MTLQSVTTSISLNIKYLLYVSAIEDFEMRDFLQRSYKDKETVVFVSPNIKDLEFVKQTVAKIIAFKQNHTVLWFDYDYYKGCITNLTCGARRKISMSRLDSLDNQKFLYVYESSGKIYKLNVE